MQSSMQRVHRTHRRCSGEAQRSAHFLSSSHSALNRPSALCSAKRGRLHTARGLQSAQSDLLDEEDDGDISKLSWGGFRGASVALGAVPSLELVKVADKNRLKPHLRSELARRLRREAPELGVLTGRMRVLRVFRFALDDLRLYQAIYESGMEGRIVVVDEPAHAHVVLATRNTRTGRQVVTHNAENLARNLGVPYVELERVSGIQLMRAVAPIMGVDVPAHLLQPRGPPRQVLSPALPTSAQSDQLAQLLSSSTDATAAAAAVTVGQALRQGRRLPQTADVGRQRPQLEAAATPSAEPTVDTACDALQQAVLSDVGDTRGAWVPRNPTERLGARYTIDRPIRHRAKVRLREAQKAAEAQGAPW